MSGSVVRRFSTLTGSISSTRLAGDLNAYEIISEIDIQLYDRSAPQGQQMLLSGPLDADTRG